MQVCQRYTADQRVVVICPDSIRNYLTKFADDSWMRRHGFTHTDWEVGTIVDILRAMPKRELVTVNITDSVQAVLDSFKEHGISQMPVLDHGSLAGILTESDVLRFLVNGRATAETAVVEVMERKVSTITLHASSSELPRIFERGEVALVVDDKGKAKAVITKMDLIDILASRQSVS